MDNNLLSGNFSNIEAKIEIARDLIREQNFVQARKFLSELVKLSSKNPEINYLLGQLYEIDADYKNAAKCYANLLAYDLSYELKTRLSQCFLDAEEYDLAYDLFRDLYDNNTQDVSIIEQFAHTARIMGKPGEAVAAYNKILKLDKNNIIALTQLAEIYYDAQDKMNHYLVKAKLNYIQNMFSSSVDCFKKALNYSREDDEIVSILMNLAKVLAESEKYEEAIDQYLFVLNLDPRNEIAQTQVEFLHDKLAEKDYEEPTSTTWFEKLFIYLNII
ncbi:MAG: hypothetical protein PHE78_01785 [Candidatus Gastranaerophilales bacterium]|nr:hypothetical protein [Candidatus Gastranaerophilales bacterium]